MMVRIAKRLDGFYYPEMQIVMGKASQWITLFIRGTQKPLRFETEEEAGKVIQKWVLAGCKEDLMLSERQVGKTTVDLIDVLE